MSASPSLTTDDRANWRTRTFTALNVLGVYVLVVVLVALGCAVSDKFLDPKNLTNALRAVTLLGIVAAGVSFITYSRHYVDLSIPGIMALSGIVAVSALKYGIVASLAAGMLAGLMIGLINGLVVGYLRLNPIIWTLAMMSVLSGVIRKAYGGKQVYPDETTAAGRAFLALYHMEIPLPAGIRIYIPRLDVEVTGIPLITVILAVWAIAVFLVLRKTPFGAQLKLTGSSYEVARMTGVNVRRTVLLAFVLSAGASAMGGILLTSFNKVGAAYIGRGYDFQAITAVVLGGMTLAGGRGSIVGVIGGVMVIALMSNVMSLVNIDEMAIGPFVFRNVVIGEWTKAIVQGAVFILVVGLNSLSRRKAGLDDA